MIYLWGFIVFILAIAFISSTQIGQAISAIILIFMVLFFIVAAVGFNKARDESDREKYKDKDKTYFNQKVTSYRDDGQSSPRWVVWLGFLTTPILFGLALYFGGK